MLSSKRAAPGSGDLIDPCMAHERGPSPVPRPHPLDPNVHATINKRSLTVRLGLLLSLFVALMVGSYVVVSRAVAQKANDAYVLNVAGRQRALIHKYNGQTNRALVALAVSDWETLVKEKAAAVHTATLFEQTHQAFMEGGTTLFGSQSHQDLQIPRAGDALVRIRLDDVSREWARLKQVAAFTLRSKSHAMKNNRHVDALQKQCDSASAAMDAVVSQMQQQSEKKLRRIETLQTDAVVAAFFLFAGVMVFSHAKIVVPLDRATADLSASNRELAYSTARMRAIVDSAADGIITIDERGIIESFNVAAEEIFGYAADEAIGQEVTLLIPGPVVELYRSGLRRYLQTGEKKVIGKIVEISGRKKDGQEVPLALSISDFEAGGRRMFAGIIRDITDRKRLDAELSQTNEDLLAVNQIHKALFACQSSGEVAETLADAMVEKFDAYFARVWLVRPGDLCSQCVLSDHCPEKKRCLHLTASSGRYTHIDGDHRRVPLGAFKIGLIAKGRGKTISNDVFNDDCVHDREWAAKHGLQSFAGFPLVRDGEVVGVLAMFSRRTLPMHLLESLDLLSQLGVSAIANVANLESIKQAKEEVAHQNEFLNTILESLDYPFLVVDVEDYSVRMANTAARRDAPSGASTCFAMTHHRDLPCDEAEHKCPMVEVIRTGKPVKVEHVHNHADGSPRMVEVHAYPVFDENSRVAQVIEYSLDITERKRAEKTLEDLHKQLQDASRQAGMADVASGVLHNVGNVLNSVSVSASVVCEKLRKSRISGLTKATALIRRHADDLGTYLSEDEKGKQLPGYLIKVAEHLADEQVAILDELQSLCKNIGHIKEIVSMQQSFTGVLGVVEPVSVSELLDDALKMSAASFQRHGVQVVREYDEMAPILVDKHKLLQILVNIVRNAKHALCERGGQGLQLTLRICPAGDESARIEVIDNGVGIPEGNITRIFAHGFTTKADGHGFGLHSSALAAKDLGGSLTAQSDGPGEGATFTLKLPLEVMGVSQ